MKHLKLYEEFRVEAPDGNTYDLDQEVEKEGLDLKKEVKILDIPVDQIEYSEWNELGTDPKTVEKYSKIPAKEFPPIVVTKNNNQLVVINGAHRLDAAKMRGDKKIKSYLLSSEIYQILINFGDEETQEYLDNKREEAILEFDSKEMKYWAVYYHIEKAMEEAQDENELNSITKDLMDKHIENPRNYPLDAINFFYSRKQEELDKITA